MKRIKLFYLFVLFLVLTVTVYAHAIKDYPLIQPFPESVLDHNMDNIYQPKEITQLIVGKWEIAPNKRASKGSITFDKNGSYEMHEQFHDGTGVGTKGEYKLNTDLKPSRIDLCLGECGKPGSEWTTRFGIIRVLSNEKLEIFTSPDGKYPSGFSDDTSDEYTMILTKAN